MSQAGSSQYAIDPPTLESSCSGIACDVNAMLAVVVVMGAFAVGAVALLHCVRRAQTTVSLEHDRLVDEYEAFLEFADRVAGIQVAPRPDGGQPLPGNLVTESDGSLQKVRTAYRETVMSVPHFETDYDESLPEHIATELSPELASAVVDGTHLTPAIRRPLIASARTAARDRQVLADELASEIDDLEDAEAELQDYADRVEVTDGEGLLDRTFPDLQARWGRLDDLGSECAALLQRRQRQLRDRAPSAGTRLQSPTAVSNYLYSDLEVDFPVLSAGTRLVERIETEKRHTLEALSRRRR